MSKELDFGWYVVRCFSSHEKKVKEFLDREIEDQKLEHKIKDVLVPTETIVEIRNGKKRTRERISSQDTFCSIPILTKK